MTDDEREQAIKSGKIAAYLYEEKPIRFGLKEGEIEDVDDGAEPDFNSEITIDYFDFPEAGGEGYRSEHFDDFNYTPECVRDLWDRLATHYHNDEEL